MMKSMLRIFSLFSLCLLLVYAPEIYTAVSAPYRTTAPKRSLLRIALCSQDDAAVSSLNKMLSQYQKAYPAVHLRVSRVDEQQMLSLSEPLPDVYLFPESMSGTLALQLLPDVRAYHPDSGETLLCAISNTAASPDAAVQFADYINEATSAQTESEQF